ncbi:MAG: hypothetical protein KC656_36050 [Myxococcales bacterium]|nr:hypothetical protein [Myxococcales bacterium]
MKQKGRLEFVDLGPGQWVLHTSGGQVALFGDIDQALNGRTVEVTGSRADGASAGMVSNDAVMVQSVRALD